VTQDLLLRTILKLPGVTAAHLLHWADNVVRVAHQLLMDGYPEAAREARELAHALRLAAPRFPDPPRIPANATEGG
jgi:hypothetical protein